jgi:hypothetical protein
MNTLVALLLLLVFSTVLVFGLLSLLRDLLQRTAQDEPTFGLNRKASDLNLPGNFDHILRLQIESIDDFGGITIEKRE